MHTWHVTFVVGAGLRTFRVAAATPADAEDQARTLLVMDAVDAEMVRVHQSGCEHPVTR